MVANQLANWGMLQENASMIYDMIDVFDVLRDSFSNRLAQLDTCAQ